MDVTSNKSAQNPTLADSCAEVPGVSAMVIVDASASFGEIPLPLLDVLGRSVLLRTLDRLRAAGIGNIAVLSSSEALPALPPPVVVHPCATDSLWDAAAQLFRRLARHSQRVLVIRLGAWVEVDYIAMLEAHARHGGSLLRACTLSGAPLDVLVLSASASSRSEASTLFASRLLLAGDPALFVCTGYVNSLCSPADLRTLALDAFAGDASVAPMGHELRPGVWAGRGVRLHPAARVLAPAYLGDFTCVRRAALITRGSVLEHHSEADCAAVIDNSTVLPCARIGAGVELERSVAGFGHVHSLLRGFSVEIADPHLIGHVPARLVTRMLTFASRWLNFLPSALWKVLFEASLRRQAALFELPASTNMSAPGEASLATVEAQSDSYREMVARRYGNQ